MVHKLKDVVFQYIPVIKYAVQYHLAMHAVYVCRQNYLRNSLLPNQPLLELACCGVPVGYIQASSHPTGHVTKLQQYKTAEQQQNIEDATVYSHEGQRYP